MSSTLSRWVPGMRVGLVSSPAGQRMMVATNWPELETSTPRSLVPSSIMTVHPPADSSSTMTATSSNLKLEIGIQV